MRYLLTHLDTAWALTLIHLRLALVPLLLGLLIAVPLGTLVQRIAVPRRITTVLASIVFTIPSLALFVVLPLIIPTRILDEANVIVALTLYTVALLVRAVPEALDALRSGARTLNAFLGGYTIDKTSDPACGWSGCTTALTTFGSAGPPVVPPGVRRRHGCNAHAYGATFNTTNNKSNYARGVETIQKYFGKVGHATLGSGVVPRAPLTTEN